MSRLITSLMLALGLTVAGAASAVAQVPAQTPPSAREAIEKGKELDSQLAKAAYMAHKLTQALRMKGYEAYEFHDRYASIVTVGSFDSVGQTRPDGVTELDPRITAIIDQFKSEGSSQGMVTAKTLVGIPFDPQPILVHVPKRSASAVISQNRRGLE